jgi:hypothetical protein
MRALAMGGAPPRERGDKRPEGWLHDGHRVWGSSLGMGYLQDGAHRPGRGDARLWSGG